MITVKNFNIGIKSYFNAGIMLSGAQTKREAQFSPARLQIEL